MANIYVIGAGFSKTVGIATDFEMLEALDIDTLLPKEPQKDGSNLSAINSILDQNFQGRRRVSFELFMSTVSALKFHPEFLSDRHSPNVFQKDDNVFKIDEKQVRSALKKYLKTCVANVDWTNEGAPILDFARLVNWKEDFVLTFNYDLLIEKAAKHLKIDVGDGIIHLHGKIGDRKLAWPTYTKLASNSTKKSLGPHWRSAFNALRDQKNLTQLIFIGYSLPATDLEAKGLFNYTDWYNGMPPIASGKDISTSHAYGYEIVVVNPDDRVKCNYAFLRNKPIFHKLTLEQWIQIQKNA